MLSYTHIKAAVDWALAQKREESRITAEYVLDGIKEVYERCIQAVPGLDKQGNPTGKWTFDASNANKALENLGR